MLQKKLLIAAALAGFSLIGFSSVANAALPGFYVGGQLGWGHTGWSTSDTTPSASSVDNNGIAGRVSGGYQFNENWAAELGYSRFSNTDFNKIGGIPGFNATVKNEYAVDLVGKGILPLGNCFNLYGKLGAAYLSAEGTTNFGGSSNTEHKVYPTFGVGVSYDITPNVPVDLSWNRIQKVGSNDLPSTDLVALGIAYNFG